MRQKAGFLTTSADDCRIETVSIILHIIRCIVIINDSILVGACCLVFVLLGGEPAIVFVIFLIRLVEVWMYCISSLEIFSVEIYWLCCESVAVW